MKQTRRGIFFPVRTFIVLTLLFALVLAIYSLMNEKGSLLLQLAASRNDTFNTIFLTITRMGEEHIFLIAILICIFISYRKSAAFSLAGILSLVISFIAKSIFSHPRPKAYFTERNEAELLGEISGYEFHTAMTSMPSGHTMAAFAFFFLLAGMFKSKFLQVFLFLMASLTGISRIYLGQHFTEDVAAGSLFGLGIGMLSYFLVNKVWEDRTAMDRSILKP